MRQQGAMPVLIVTADDYGYRPAYDRGILEAARAEAVDAVSAMVGRGPLRPEPLLATGVEIGLHLQLPGIAEETRPGPAEREAAIAALGSQLSRFEEAFGRPAAYLDGHHHCHARDGLAVAIARVAAERGMPVRSIHDRHRRLLQCLGVPTPDRLVGRLESSGPGTPELLRSVLQGETPPPSGVTEWMVHPGHPDPDPASSYDAAREEDLRLVLEVGDELGRLFARRSHAVL
jgi:chitin disaccharide deacetylase